MVTINLRLKIIGPKDVIVDHIKRLKKRYSSVKHSKLKPHKKSKINWIFIVKKLKT